MSGVVLLEESLPFRGSIQEKITEGGVKRLRVRGLYQLANVRNKNKRVYPNSLWERILSEGSEFQQRLSHRRVLGELAHPSGGKTSYEKVSHLVERAWMDEGQFLKGCEICEAGQVGTHRHVYGEELVSATPCGLILQELYELGCEVGVSSRGSGSLKQTTGDESVVAEDYRLETWDHVTDPSTPGCWNSSLKESIVSVVSKLEDQTCDLTMLNAYKGVLEGVLLEESDITIVGRTRSLVEAIDAKLATPACTAAAKQFAMSVEIPKGSPLVSEYNHDKVSRTIIMETTINLSNPDVRRIVESETLKVKDEMSSDLASAYGALERQRQEFEQEIIARDSRLEAQEKAGRELMTQLKESQLKVATYEQYINSLTNQATDEATGQPVHRKLELAEHAVNKLVERCREYKVFERRSQALESLLEQVIERVRSKDTANHVESLLARESDAFAEHIRPSLYKCESIEEINRLYGTIKQAVNLSVSESRHHERAQLHVESRTRPTRVRELSEGALPLVGASIEEQTRLDGRSLPRSTDRMDESNFQRQAASYLLKKMGRQPVNG